MSNRKMTDNILHEMEVGEHSNQYETNILFDAGVWQLKAYPYRDDWNSLILHWCENNRGKAREMIPMWRLPAGLIRGYTDCPRCGSEMPDSIITLWRLHNMEQIQQYHAEFGGEFAEKYPS